MNTRTAATQRLTRKYGPAWAVVLKHPGLTFRRIETAIWAARKPWRVIIWTTCGALVGVLAGLLVILTIQDLTR